MRHIPIEEMLAGEPPVRMVVALHCGTVIYGNIGAAARLDFTVIGLAVNLVSRIEAVAKALDLPIVVSEAFARAHGGNLRSLGRHELRGLGGSHELFAPPSGRPLYSPDNQAFSNRRLGSLLVL